jgi:Na+/H+ antiporter NhaC
MKQFFFLAFFIACLLGLFDWLPILANPQKPAAKQTTKDKKALPPAALKAANVGSKSNSKAAPVSNTSSSKATSKPNSVVKSVPTNVAPIKTVVNTPTAATQSLVKTVVPANTNKVGSGVAAVAASATAVGAAGLAASSDTNRHVATYNNSTVDSLSALVPIVNGIVTESKADMGGLVFDKGSFSPIKGIGVLLPICLAFLLSLWWGESLFSLLIAIVVGAWALNGFNMGQLFKSILQVFDTHLIQTIANPANIVFSLFLLLMGAVAGITYHNGGALGWAESMGRTIKTRRSAQVMAWLAALFTAFDPFVSAMFSGNIARPLNDRYGGSREKLAYIIHTTSSTVAALVLFSTFAGSILPLVGKQISSWANVTPMSVYLYALQYAFYPIFALLLVVATILWQRHIGAMHSAELNAQGKDASKDTSNLVLINNSETVAPLSKQTQVRGFYLLLPILVFFIVAFVGIFRQASQQLFVDNPTTLFNNLLTAVQQANVALSLLWAAIATLGVTVVLSILSRRLSLLHTVDSITWGMKNALPTVITFVLAFTLIHICSQLGVSAYITQHLSGYGTLWLPFVAFIATALVSAVTGNLFSAVLLTIPILLPIAASQAYDGSLVPLRAAAIFYGTLANCIGGALFGAHLSITAQSALVSALSAQCSPINHIRTQLPYAFLAATLNLLAIALCIAFSLPAWVPLLGGVILIPILVRVLSQAIPTDATDAPDATHLETNDHSDKLVATVLAAEQLNNEEPITQLAYTHINSSEDISPLPLMAEQELAQTDMQGNTALIDTVNAKANPYFIADDSETEQSELIGGAAEAGQMDMDKTTKDITANYKAAPLTMANDEPIVASDKVMPTNETASRETTAYNIYQANETTVNKDDDTTEQHVNEAVSKTKDMFQSMKDIIASISNDEPEQNDSNAAPALTTEQEEALLAATEKKMLRYIKADDEAE